MTLPPQTLLATNKFASLLYIIMRLQEADSLFFYTFAEIKAYVNARRERYNTEGALLNMVMFVKEHASRYTMVDHTGEEAEVSAQQQNATKISTMIKCCESPSGLSTWHCLVTTYLWFMCLENCIYK